MEKNNKSNGGRRKKILKYLQVCQEIGVEKYYKKTADEVALGLGRIWYNLGLLENKKIKLL